MTTPSSPPTALVADDEPNLARLLVAELQALWPELQVLAVARNGIEAAERIAALQPDVAFLDIKMPGLTGLEVAQGIEGNTRVVFVTAYDDYAVQAFEAEAVDYVLKPVQRERLSRTLERLRQILAGSATPARAQPPDASEAALAALLRRLAPVLPGARGERLRWVRASSGDITHQIAVDDVLFFHADDKYTTVQTAAADYVIRTPLAELTAALDPALFCQVHRSTVINLQHLAGTRRDDNSRLFLRIKGYARELPVSRAYVHLFKAM
jgi:DNA-binding LytR/AlgR family response regulator